jgi:hypothetical protein
MSTSMAIRQAGSNGKNIATVSNPVTDADFSKPI